ncbi:glycosyltransferase [candidate division KSB1 bacterium]|nr:glycosyltransferase [candidate division KSB1 bacterium]
MHDPIDIYTICYEPDEFLRKCLDSIFRHTSQPYNAIAVVGKRPIAANRNQGLVVSRSEWVASIDADCTVTQDNWLELLLETANSRPDVGLVGCKVVMYDGRIFSCGTLENSMPRDFDRPDSGQFESVEVVHGVTENLMLIRKDLLMFDESFDRSKGYEGEDFAIRLRRLGYCVLYDGRVKAIHHKDPAPRSSYNWDHIFFHLKHPGTARQHLKMSSTLGDVLRKLRDLVGGTGKKHA